MSTATAFLSAVEARRSIYDLTDASPISDERIKEIVSLGIKNAPSSFNVQSTRAVLVLRGEHKKLWDIGDKALKEDLPAAYDALAPKVAGFRAAYGTVLWFEDEAALTALREKQPALKPLIGEWSDHGSGINQFIVWTALEQEGLGANLQHYNFSPYFARNVKEQWNLPATWNLKAQLVFGKPGGAGPKAKTINPVEERLRVFGSS